MSPPARHGLTINLHSLSSLHHVVEQPNQPFFSPPKYYHCIPWHSYSLSKCALLVIEVYFFRSFCHILRRPSNFHLKWMKLKSCLFFLTCDAELKLKSCLFFLTCDAELKLILFHALKMTCFEERWNVKITVMIVFRFLIKSRAQWVSLRIPSCQNLVG